jgi:hypothetical protein
MEFIDKTVSAKFLYDEEVVPKFVEAYFSWIQSSKLNRLKNLDKFNVVDYVHGTSQAFDFFYMKHKDRRFRCMQGDFAYHRVSWKNYFDWAYIEADALRPNDAFIISLPFSDLGAQHPKMNEILDRCDELEIPVFIDAAYHCIARGLDFDLDRPCIEAVAFSMSKGFYGVERLRVGIRCRRENIDDGIVIMNGFHMVSKIGAGVGLEICKNFEYDYNHNKFRKKQLEICSELDIQPSDCVIFGITNPSHQDFGEYDRGTDWRRVCLSHWLGE